MFETFNIYDILSIDVIFFYDTIQVKNKDDIIFLISK